VGAAAPEVSNGTQQHSTARNDTQRHSTALNDSIDPYYAWTTHFHTFHFHTIHFHTHHALVLHPTLTAHSQHTHSTLTAHSHLITIPLSLPYLQYLALLWRVFR
jgi:hypothetical protein